MIDDLFKKKPLDPSRVVCHSGGAVGSDTVFEEIGAEFGVNTKAYSYKTKSHVSPNKVEISAEDYAEGVAEIARANRTLGRYGINKYMSLLARNWAQVKYSRQVFAIGFIVEAGAKGPKGYKNTAKIAVVDGGTGYAVMMAINNEREVFVFDQKRNAWFRWSYVSNAFIELRQELAITESDFAGIGTREIAANGIAAIRRLYEKTFNLA